MRGGVRRAWRAGRAVQAGRPTDLLWNCERQGSSDGQHWNQVEGTSNEPVSTDRVVCTSRRVAGRVHGRVESRCVVDAKYI